MTRLFFIIAACLFSLWPAAGSYAAQPEIDDRALERLTGEIRDILSADIVRRSVLNQNRKYAGLGPARIRELDSQWRDEHGKSRRPLMTSVMAHPLSMYLTRIQAAALGRYVEIFVMDGHGLNVGQSAVTSDYWQGDEAKWQRTFEQGEAPFIDEAEFDPERKIWKRQINLPVTDGNGARIGAATFEINLTELVRRSG